MHTGFQPNAQLVANCTSEEEGCSLMAPPPTDATTAQAALRNFTGCVLISTLTTSHLDYVAVDAEVVFHEELIDGTIIWSIHHSDVSSDGD